MEKYKLLNIIIAACCLSALITFFATVIFNVKFFLLKLNEMNFFFYKNKGIFEEKYKKRKSKRRMNSLKIYIKLNFLSIKAILNLYK